jgi:hypothetical protein
LFLARTCLKSDSFSSFINAVWWPTTYNNRVKKLLPFRTYTVCKKLNFRYLIMSAVKTIHSVTIIILDIGHCPVFYLKNTLFQRLATVLVFRWNLLRWTQ